MHTEARDQARLSLHANSARAILVLAEVIGAVGLILPGLLRIRPMLTPLDACRLLIDMMGATAVAMPFASLRMT